MNIEIKHRRQPYADGTLKSKKKADLIAIIRRLEQECDSEYQTVSSFTKMLRGITDPASEMFEKLGYEVHIDVKGNPFYVSEDGKETIYFRNGRCYKIHGKEFRQMTDDEIVASAQAIRERRSV